MTGPVLVDSNVLVYRRDASAAKEAACEYLLTEDLYDGMDVFGVRVIDPFAHEPGEVGR